LVHPDLPAHLDLLDRPDLEMQLSAMTILLHPCSDLLDLLDLKAIKEIRAIWAKEDMTDLLARWVQLVTLAPLVSAPLFLLTQMALISLLLTAELVHQMLLMFLNVRKVLKVNPVLLVLKDRKDLLDNVEKLERLA